jgi:hypothetical protein
MSPEEYWDGEGIRFLNEDGTLPTVEQRVKEGFKRGYEVGVFDSEVERLREEVKNWHQHYRDEACRAQKCKQAFIEQEKEVARLRAEVQRAIEDRNRIGIEIRGEYLPKLKDQDNEVARLREENECFKRGCQGSCYACEPVGEMNLKLEAEVARLREAIKPFLRFANGIPDNWPEQCILRFDQRNDGSLYVNYYGVQDASDGITIKQWRELAQRAPAPEGPVSEGTRIAAEARAACNGLTEEERKRLSSLAEDVLKLHKPDKDCRLTRRPLPKQEEMHHWPDFCTCDKCKPKQEEMPLDQIDESLKWIEGDGKYPLDHDEMFGEVCNCLRYLRDEIQKLKEAR